MHLSREAAAEQIGCGLTHFKKLCRANNIRRWPSRQVQAILSAQAELSALESPVIVSTSGKEEHLPEILSELEKMLRKIQLDPNCELGEGWGKLQERCLRVVIAAKKKLYTQMDNFT